MLATKGNLLDHFKEPSPHEIMYCTECGAEYSAHKGDYWDVPDDHEFECCGVTMVLGYWQRTFIESR